MNYVRGMGLALISLLVGFVVGRESASISTRVEKPNSGAETVPAYLIGAAQITDYERLPEYRAVAEPLAREEGYVVLAAAEADSAGSALLEGDWPAQGLLFIERYDSMERLLRFVNSEAFQDAKGLRDEVAEVHFMIALEGGEQLGH